MILAWLVCSADFVIKKVPPARRQGSGNRGGGNLYPLPLSEHYCEQWLGGKWPDEGFNHDSVFINAQQSASSPSRSEEISLTWHDESCSARLRMQEPVSY